MRFDVEQYPRILDRESERGVESNIYDDIGCIAALAETIPNDWKMIDAHKFNKVIPRLAV